MSSVSALNSLLSTSTSSTGSSSINLSSLLSAATGATSTGIDVTSAVAAAIYAAQAPERQWQSQQITVKSQIATLTSIKTALSTLSSDLATLNNLSGPLTSRTVASSSNVVSATAADGSSIGSHTVSVSSLAASASWYSPAVPSASATLGSMQLQIVGSTGSTNTFSTGKGVNSLADLIGAINSSKSGISASVVTDANGARLALVGDKTGAANDFSVSFAAVSGSNWTSTPVASASTPLAPGSFQIGDGSQSSTISVSLGDNLSSVAAKINSAGLSISASVTTDSTGSRLSLSASAGSLSVTGDPAFNLTRASRGSNASLSVDGVPVSSASNTVTGAVSGLTLNLFGTTASSNPATLSIAADHSQIASTISSFVTNYNSALSLVNSQFAYNTGSGSQGVLSGDATLRSLQSALMGIVGYTAPASSSGTSKPSSSLASLGITMGNDGSLSLNTTTLNQAISSNNAAVQNFFQGTTLNGFAKSFEDTLKTFTSPSTGALAISLKNLNTTYSGLQSQVNDYESGYIASQRTVLTAMYSKAEIALQSLPATLKELQAQLGGNSGR